MKLLKGFKSLPLGDYQTDGVRIFSNTRNIFLPPKEGKRYYQIYKLNNYACIGYDSLMKMHKDTKGDVIQLETMEKYAPVKTTTKHKYFIKEEVVVDNTLFEEKSTIEKIREFLVSIDADFRITTTEDKQKTSKKIEIFL